MIRKWLLKRGIEILIKVVEANKDFILKELNKNIDLPGIDEKEEAVVYSNVYNGVIYILKKKIIPLV